MPNYYGNMQDCSRRNSGGCNNNWNGNRSNMNCRNTHSDQRYDHRRSDDSCRCEKEQNRKCSTCSVRETIEGLSDMPLAMAYVPWQCWDKIYDTEKGFCRGTIFKELDKPFEGRGGC